MKTTLWNILNNTVNNLSIPNGITIPKIQRDYAQGRDTLRANEIRNEFLKNIHDSVLAVKNHTGNALDLDFVYGTNDLGSFIPLDGQQRLTTLFLLHWYLAFKENKLEFHRHCFPKFHYETRPTSNMFLRALCDKFENEEYEKIFINEADDEDEKIIFETIIKNENWYFSSWKSDNTIESMITMLDCIHQIFKHSEISLEDLISNTNPPITFNFLQLNTLRLSDNLYIKMNARGKQLTSFENLKAQIAKLIKDSNFNNKYNYHLQTSAGDKVVDVETYFVTKVDTAWSDYFWKIKEQDYTFDNKLLNLLTFVSLNELIITDIDKYDQAISKLTNLEEVSYYTLNELGLLNENSIIKYIDIVDVLSSANTQVSNFIKESGFEEEVLSQVFSNKVSPDYERRIKFQGVFNFILKNNNTPSYSELQKWGRLLYNLTGNTIYDSSKDFATSLNGINSFLEKYSNDVYQDFVTFSIKGFDNVQTKEESIKHQLKLKSNNWIELIDIIENHGFLKGQISSLLMFSSIYESFETKSANDFSDNDLYFMYVQLDENYKIFNQIFSSAGLIEFKEEEFRRALLCFGDFAIYSTNWFFYNNSNSRDLSWKRLLKETANKSKSYQQGADILINLFKNLNSSVPLVKQFNKIIKEYLKDNKEKDWRHYFIKYPTLFLSAKQHYVKFFDLDEDFYCLNKTKYNKESDYDFMSLIVRSELQKNNIDTDKIEFEYNYKYEQFGISKINGKSVKIVYNSPFHGNKFIIKTHGKDEVFMSKHSAVVKFIIDDYFS